MSDGKQRRPPGRQFIAPAGRAGNGHGYLTQPLRPMPLVADSPEVVARIADATSTTDEPESISGAIVDAFGGDADFFSRIRHAAEVEAARDSRMHITPENRIADARRRAKQRKLNLSHAFHKAETALARARKAGREPADAVIEKIEQLEAFLDGPVDDLGRAA